MRVVRNDVVDRGLAAGSAGSIRNAMRWKPILAAGLLAIALTLGLLFSLFAICAPNSLFVGVVADPHFAHHNSRCPRHESDEVAASRRLPLLLKPY